ncbi:hypothetical protein [Stenotrophomonas muris]|uniref:hypothetical protein n=1 Tax=Stenotrophomonas muris TaxID=2963283 RepID=UPI0039C64FDB
MSHLLQNHLGLVVIAVLVGLGFIAVVLALAFGWARQRAEHLEQAQRSIEAIQWPGGNGYPRSARTEMRSGPR